jgi:hypothetical protein
MEAGKPLAGEHEPGNVDDSTSRKPLTRRKALGMAGVAVGGAALAGLVEASSADAAGVSGTSSLKVAAAQGATTITVVSTTGFTANHTIWLDLGGQAESAAIKSVASSTHTVTLKTPLKQAHHAGARVSIIGPEMTGSGTLKTVLSKILNDSAYATAAVKSPLKITTDYPHISVLELETLRNCAILSGADMGAINTARADAIGASAAGDLGLITTDPTGPALGFSVSCCSCCCCIKITVNGKPLF